MSLLSMGQDVALLIAILLAGIGLAHIPGVKGDVPNFLKFLHNPILILFSIGIGIFSAISTSVSVFPYLTAEMTSADAGLEVIYYSLFVFLPLSVGLITSSIFLCWTGRGLSRGAGIVGLCAGVSFFIYWLFFLFLF